MESVSEKIKQIRKSLNLSQAEFASKLGVTRGHISNLETGLASPSEQLLRLISQIYLVRLEWLTKGSGSRFDVVEKAIQKEIYSTIQSHLRMFLNFHREMSSIVVDALQEQSSKLSPELCPPEVLNQLREVLKIPDEEIFLIVRESLKKWS